MKPSVDHCKPVRSPIALPHYGIDGMRRREKCNMIRAIMWRAKATEHTFTALQASCVVPELQYVEHFIIDARGQTAGSIAAQIIVDTDRIGLAVDRRKYGPAAHTGQREDRIVKPLRFDATHEVHLAPQRPVAGRGRLSRVARQRHQEILQVAVGKWLTAERSVAHGLG